MLTRLPYVLGEEMHKLLATSRKDGRFFFLPLFPICHPATPLQPVTRWADPS